MEIHEELDASGMTCPLPVLHAKKRLDKMDSGHILKVIATDPGSVSDIAALARHAGHELLESREEAGKFYYLMKKR